MATQAARLPVLSALYAEGRLSLRAPDGAPTFTPSRDLNDRVTLWKGDITRLDIDAIVNAASRQLMGGGGVDGAIHRAAGEKLLWECMKLGGCPTGQSKSTKAYALPCKRIIHTVGPVWHEYTAQEASRLLASCYQSSFQTAVRDGCSSIAFCSISTGIYGFPKRDATKIALSSTRAFLSSPEGARIRRVVFVLFDEQDEKEYTMWLPAYFPPLPAESTEAA